MFRSIFINLVRCFAGFFVYPNGFVDKSSKKLSKLPVSKYTSKSTTNQIDLQWKYSGVLDIISGKIKYSWLVKAHSYTWENASIKFLKPFVHKMYLEGLEGLNILFEMIYNIWPEFFTLLRPVRILERLRPSFVTFFSWWNAEKRI